jgi:hypothetical protein
MKSAQDLAKEWAKAFEDVVIFENDIERAYLAGFAAGREQGLEEAARVAEKLSGSQFGWDYSTCPPRLRASLGDPVPAAISALSQPGDAKEGEK